MFTFATVVCQFPDNEIGIRNQKMVNKELLEDSRNSKFGASSLRRGPGNHRRYLIFQGPVKTQYCAVSKSYLFPPEAKRCPNGPRFLALKDLLLKFPKSVSCSGRLVSSPRAFDLWEKKNDRINDLVTAAQRR